MPSAAAFKSFHHGANVLPKNVANMDALAGYEVIIKPADVAALLNLYKLSPDMKMHILLTVLHTFNMELERRIYVNIKTGHPW